MNSSRAGKFVRQPTDYVAFIPKPLPPEPPLDIDTEICNLLAGAAEKLGRLDGITVNLPNPDPFISMFVRKEAVLSSQIEGTQASLDDILAYELKLPKDSMPFDVEEIVNYVKSMNYGLKRLTELPLSLRLIREIHEQLLMNACGGDRAPGEFRTSQNWIGPAGCTLSDAVFIPPPPAEMKNAMGSLENYLHEDTKTPNLIKAALVHAQFETIHPFLDGNGRIGRLLITFMLCYYGSLSRPLLYLSYFFKQHRSHYYESLNRIRTDGDWEGWVKLFLRGVSVVSDMAIDAAKKILRLRENHILLITKSFNRGTPNAQRFLDLLYDNPTVTATYLANRLNVSRPTAYALIRKFLKIDILREGVKNPWGRLFTYYAYLDILREGTRA